MNRALLFVAGVALLTASPASAQAWLGSQGEVTTSFVLSRSFADGHDLNGLRDMNADIFTNSLLADVTFSVRDNLAVTLAVPIVTAKFVSRGTPPHPNIQDNGSYHTTVTDLRFDLRYNVFNRHNLVITPFIGSVTPSHKYEYFAHAAPGRRVNELQIGTYVGTTLDGLLPGMFVQGRYGYGIQETFQDVSHNKSVFSGEMGYFATPDIRVFGMVSGQVTHGGVDLSPTARLTLPPGQWQNHDRITRENFTTVGGGIGWTVNDVLDVFGSYTTMVQSVNTHILNRGLLFGASIRVQKSALERAIVNLSAGNRIAGWACRKGMAL